MLEILRELLLVQVAAVPLVQSIGEVPMQECDQWLDTCSAQVVDEFDVVLDALFIHGVIASAQGDDARPREGEAVRVCARRLQQLDVLGRTVVGITRDVAIGSVPDLARDVGEDIPYAVALAICLGTPFNLVAVHPDSVTRTKESYSGGSPSRNAPCSREPPQKVLGQM